jgi:hypothetical protein
MKGRHPADAAQSTATDSSMSPRGAQDKHLVVTVICLLPYVEKNEKCWDIDLWELERREAIATVTKVDDRLVRLDRCPDIFVDLRSPWINHCTFQGA